jgi:peptide/nickel transport system ATP-binding protein
VSLELRAVTVGYGHGRGAVTAVEAADLEIPSGSVVGLVGESGCGKSSLARAVCGLAPLRSGRILLDGRELSSSGQRRRVQMVFQDPYASLNPRMTVGEALAEAIAVRGRLPAEARRQEVARLLELVALDPAQAALFPRQLSGGQRQRVAIARALAASPDYLVADEITSALDASVQGAVLNLLREIRRRLGLAILFISHNLAVVRYLSDVIAVMYLGRIVEVAPAEELVRRPRHPYTLALLAAVPSVWAPVSIEDDELDDEPPDLRRPPSGCRFHPRCPLGPGVRADRAICRELDPQVGAEAREHRAACHFAPAADPSRREVGGA